MENESVRLEFAATLCQRMLEVGIRYGIIHGAERYPEKVGRDLDVMLSKTEISHAVDVVRNKATELGWNSVVAPISWAGAPVIFWKTENWVTVSFEMHFIDQITWNGVVLASFESTEIQKHPDHCLPFALQAGFTKRVLTQILAGCWDRMEERKDEIAIFDYEKKSAPSLIKKIFGNKHGLDLIDALTCYEAFTLKRLAPKLRLLAVFHALVSRDPIRWSPAWYFGKISRCCGFVRWRLPNLIILSYSSEVANTLLGKSLKHLGFTKAMVLKPQAPTSMKDQISERVRMRLHRGLFRFVAIAGAVADRDYITSRFPPSCRDGGNLVIEISSDDTSINATMILGPDQANFAQIISTTDIAPVIASLFFRGLRATSEGIAMFYEQ